MRWIALLVATFFCLRTGYAQATANGNVVVVEDDGSIVGHDNLFNLDSQTLRFTPNAAGGYDAALTDPAWDDDLGSEQALDRPSLQSTEVPLGFAFPFAGKTWNSVAINWTGSLSFGWREDNTARDRYFFFDDFAAGLVAGAPMI